MEVVETIKQLAQAESNVKGTSLITLYLPSGGNLWLAREHINQELKTATNIKNKNVGKSVAEALRSISYQLKTLNELPTNGLVICAGDYTINSTPNPVENGHYV